MRKKLILYLLMLLGTNDMQASSCPMTMQTEQQPTYLVLWFADGTNSRIRLFAKPLVTFDKDRVHISSPVLNFDYSAYDIIRFTYESESTAIDDSNGGKLYQYRNELVIFDSSINNSDIKLFSEDGKQVYSPITLHDNHSCLSLANVAKGVYILSVKGKSCKILKK